MVAPTTPGLWPMAAFLPLSSEPTLSPWRPDPWRVAGHLAQSQPGKAKLGDSRSSLPGTCEVSGVTARGAGAGRLWDGCLGI
jgi:hypothetical protein